MSTPFLPFHRVHVGTAVATGPFWDALESAAKQPDLFERMRILTEGVHKQIEANFRGAVDSKATHAMIEACRDEMARAILVRDLLSRHGRHYE